MCLFGYENSEGEEVKGRGGGWGGGGEGEATPTNDHNEKPTQNLNHLNS